MLLYKDASTRQARFALSRVRCVRACTRGDVDAYFRWLRYPATRPGAVDPFLPAGQQAAAGDARTPTHARRMHGRKKRAIRADPPSVMRPGVDMRAVVAGSGTACICCAPRASQHHARVCRLAGCTQARPAGKHAIQHGPSHVQPHSCGSLPALLLPFRGSHLCNPYFYMFGTCDKRAGGRPLPCNLSPSGAAARPP